MATTVNPHPPTRVAEILSMYEKGVSARDIADHFSRAGHPISRSAVLGLVHRARCKGTNLRGKAKSRAKKGNCSQVGFMVKKRAVQRNVYFLATTLPDTTSECCPGANMGRVDGIEIMELTHLTCRWPMWPHSDRPQAPKYCGGPKETGAYCLKHAEIAYTPALPIRPPRGA